MVCRRRSNVLPASRRQNFLQLRDTKSIFEAYRQDAGSMLATCSFLHPLAKKPLLDSAVTLA
jgi:hypothetical protein